jgi:uncharacterized membrane protein YagU involved in acid resistance
MIPESIWHVFATATVACVVSDLIVYAIQQAQRERSGVRTERMSVVWRLLLSILFNGIAVFLFAYTYHAVALGSGRVYLVGGALWLTITIPVLMAAHHVDDVKRAVLTTRIFGWLFKTAAAATAINYFIG